MITSISALADSDTVDQSCSLPPEWLGLIPSHGDIPLCVDSMMTIGNCSTITRSSSVGDMCTIVSGPNEALGRRSGRNQTSYSLHLTTLDVDEGITNGRLVTTAAGECSLLSFETSR